MGHLPVERGPGILLPVHSLAESLLLYWVHVSEIQGKAQH